MTSHERDERTDEAKTAPYGSEQFWQVTAAEVLGEIRSPDAVWALFEAVVDPNRTDVALPATIAMVKIGKPSMSLLVDALLGKDQDLLLFARTKVNPQRDATHSVVRGASQLMGSIGRPDGVEPLMLLLSRTNQAHHAARTIIARELANCPPSDKSYKAYVAMFESMPAHDDAPPGAHVVRGLAKDMFPHRLVQQRGADGTVKSPGQPQQTPPFPDCLADFADLQFGVFFRGEVGDS